MEPHVIFKEENHKYIFTKSPDITPVSGTKFVGHFQEKFNASYWLTVKACQALLPNFEELKANWERKGIPLECDSYLDYLIVNVDPEEMDEQVKIIKAQWDAKGKKSSEDGTAFHLEQEMASYERGWEINPFDGKKYKTIPRPKLDYCENYTIHTDLSKLKDGYYPELLVYWGRLVGQADKVFIGTDKWGRFCDISDIKTFEKLEKRGFYNRQLRKYKTFLKPIEYIEDSKFNKTALQTSTYMWCLENWGFQPRYSALEHFDKLHELKYYKREVEQMYKEFPWEKF